MQKKITLENSTAISGTLTYKAIKEATIKDGAKVAGAVSFEPRKERNREKKVAAGVLSVAIGIRFLMMLAGSLVVGLFFRRYVLTVTENAFASPLRELGRGIASIILLPIISVILFFTVIGIPFGILGLISFVALVIFTSFLAPILIGSWLHRKIKKTDHYPLSWKTILLGVVASLVIGLVPILGGIVIAFVFLITLGSMLQLKWTLIKDWR